MAGNFELTRDERRRLSIQSFKMIFCTEYAEYAEGEGNRTIAEKYYGEAIESARAYRNTIRDIVEEYPLEDEDEREVLELTDEFTGMVEHKATDALYDL